MKNEKESERTKPEETPEDDHVSLGYFEALARLVATWSQVKTEPPDPLDEPLI
jgi:hypothetical protein